MDNNLSTDKQLVSSIRNTEWIDLSTGHKTLRTSTARNFIVCNAYFCYLSTHKR